MSDTGKQTDSTITITREQLRYERIVARKADPLTGIITRDRSGNNLRDVVDGNGFCIAVVGPMTVAEGLKLIEPDPCVKGGKSLPKKAKDGMYYEGRGTSKRMIRTTDMHDDLPISAYRAQAVNSASATKADRRASAATKVKRAPKQAQSGKRGTGTGPTRAEIAAWVKQFCGYEGTLSPQVLKTARTAMAHAAQVAAYTSSR